jgi:EthD domain
VIRAFVVYETEVDPSRYEEHAALCRRVPGATFRHGPVFGAPFGEPRYRYYAEWEFADMDAFRVASRSPEFAATGKDAAEMGNPFSVFFAEVE